MPKTPKSAKKVRIPGVERAPRRGGRVMFLDPALKRNSPDRPSPNHVVFTDEAKSQSKADHLSFRDILVPQVFQCVAEGRPVIDLVFIV